MLCYADADIVRQEQAQMPLKFIRHWKDIAGVKPDWLYFDGRLTTYGVLDALREQHIAFITIRRRGPKIVENILARPSSQWSRVLINTPNRRRQKIQHLDELVRLRGYNAPCRQIAATGFGREKPTLFLTNNQDVSGRDIIKRYINRNTIETQSKTIWAPTSTFSTWTASAAKSGSTSILTSP